MSENSVFCPGNKLENKTRIFNPQAFRSKALGKIYMWGHLLKTRFRKSKTGYDRVGDDPVEANMVVPKGHLPVYVMGDKDDDTCRYMVPVIYFNHPLFGKLLREAEREFGYDHPGGIQIPCRVSEFEIVKRRIDGCSARL